MKQTWIVICVLFLSSSVFGKESLTLLESLHLAEQNNSESAMIKARVKAEYEMINVESALDNPRLGFMRERNLSSAQQDMGPMTFWTFTQEVKFPWKYHLLNSAQQQRAKAMEQEAVAVDLKIRAEVIQNYYQLIYCRKNLQILEAEKETLRQSSRVAEGKRSTGSTSQQDEMKIHVEQTKIEGEIILQKQECIETEAQFRLVLGLSQETEVSLSINDFKLPKLRVSPQEISKMIQEQNQSPEIKSSELLLSESETRLRLAQYSYAPDFMLSYKKGAEGTPGGDSIGIDVTIPLWFFSKQSSEITSAQQQSLVAKKNSEKIKRTNEAESKILAKKIATLAKLIDIYETALIPQATASLNSSGAAYRANKIGLIELLDATRSLFSTQILYHQTAVNYLASIVQLEKIVGMAISDLPFGVKYE